ncbi:MAG: hypothetical protein QMD46_13260 [Methanomicrobiales archaeon]|nr:hypothetical protein [Methanomicrobiales archaeon]MDI6877454.1 hypothetical protein [Methanomicrobiales archaeon]
MPQVKTFAELKDRIQAGLEDNDQSLSRSGDTYSTQLKAYLIESNLPVTDVTCPVGQWGVLDAQHWYANRGGGAPGSLFLDTTRERVWILYSLLGAGESDTILNKWITDVHGLDRCWLSRNQMLHLAKVEGWHQKGLGLKFSDGLSPEEDAGNFSLKAWYGANQHLQGIDDILNRAKEQFAIYSSRWQKIENGTVRISAEWYSNGKVTINKAEDVDEVFLFVSEMANRYEDAIQEATNLRNNTLGAFELNFARPIDLDAFSKTVSMGKGRMNLWLVEVEGESDFRRFKGLDLHTWDRILMDVGPDYAYLTIPNQGCVNAAPRIATIQGEDNAGKTSIYFNGDELFA